MQSVSTLTVACVQAISMQHTYEAEDEVDEASEDAATAQQQRVDAASHVSSLPEPHDGGMYFTERIAYSARKLAAKFQRAPAVTQPAASAANSGWNARS